MAGDGAKSSCCVMDNLEDFKDYSPIHGMDTRNKNQLYRPVTNLMCFQKRVSCSGLKVFNFLPTSITEFQK
jgi:hypothetical protein